MLPRGFSIWYTNMDQNKNLKFESVSTNLILIKIFY
jgi:hypothetical protein